MRDTSASNKIHRNNVIHDAIHHSERHSLIKENNKKTGRKIYLFDVKISNSSMCDVIYYTLTSLLVLNIECTCGGDKIN